MLSNWPTQNKHKNDDDDDDDYLLLLLLFFYNKSVSFFMTRANTTNVDVDRLLFFFTQVDAHILRPILYGR